MNGRSGLVAGRGRGALVRLPSAVDVEKFGTVYDCEVDTGKGFDEMMRESGNERLCQHIVGDTFVILDMGKARRKKFVLAPIPLQGGASVISTQLCGEGIDPTTGIPELLAFSKKFPEVQMGCVVVGLNAKTSDGTGFGYIGARNGTRGLGTLDISMTFRMGSNFKFLCLID